MDLVVYTSSDSFKSFIKGVFEKKVEFHSQLVRPLGHETRIHLLHRSSMGQDCKSWLQQHATKGSVVAALCSDKPDIGEMLEAVQLGAKAYCNSYMQTTHYQQMIRLLNNGQSWFPPHLLEQAFSLAQQAIAGNENHNLLDALTAREKEIALSVSEGSSNRQIADHFEISERTVKSHLTNIFKKLQLKDRVALVLHVNQS